MGLNNDFCDRIKKRDGYKCLICGVIRKKRKKNDPIQEKVVLSIHHIKSQMLHPELRYCDDNVIILCRECHKKIHLETISE